MNVLTSDNRIVKVKKNYSNTVHAINNLKPYKIPKDKYGKNIPICDTFVSEYHGFKNKGRWYLHKNTDLKQEWEEDLVTYYHIELENYETDYLVVNNMVMESWDGKNPNEYRNYKWKILKDGSVKKEYR